VVKARVLAIITLFIIAAFLSFYALYTSLTGAHKAVSSPSLITKTLAISEVDYAEIYVLVDNNGFDGFSSPWGVSLLLKTPGSMILLDAGPDPRALEKNARILEVELSEVNFVVASHEHGDHVNGLQYIAEVTSGLSVYVPEGMNDLVKKWLKDLGFNVIDVDETKVVAEGVAVVGELRGPPWEQALAVNVKGLGLVVLVGCSHPGVDNIVAKASEDLGVKPYAVIGGFHLGGAPEERLREIVKNLKALGVKKIYPIHCSGQKIRDLLQREYPELYGDGHVGMVLRFTVS